MSTPRVVQADRVVMAGALQTEYANGTLHLYTDAVAPPSVTSSFSDFTLPVFTGYAGNAVTAWSSPYRDSARNGATAMPSQMFAGPSSGDGQTIKGCIYVTGAPGNETYHWGAQFDAPIPLADSLSEITIQAQVASDGSGALVVNGTLNP